MILSAIHNERINIYNRSKPSFNILETLRIKSSMKYIEKPLIFTALYSCSISLYDFRKVHTIEESAVDKPRYSIYQRSCTTDHMISFIKQKQRI